MKGAKRIIGFLTLVAGFMDASFGIAEGCDPRGKSVEYAGRSCIQGHCAVVRRKIVALGEKILLYNNPKKSTGTVFIIGQTISLDAGEYRDPPTSRQIGGHNKTGSATATTYGSNLSLQIRYHETSASGDFATSDRRIVIEFLSCDTCTVPKSELVLSGRVQGKDLTFETTFQLYSCRVLNEP